MDWSSFRKQFPAVCGRTYLNTAGGGAMSLQAAEAGKAYYEEAASQADVLWDDWLRRTNEVRAGVARFIGGEPEGVSFLQNSSLGINIVARLFESPIEVLATDKEFPSCTTPWIRAGHSVRFIDTPADGRITADDVEAALTQATKVFVLSSVQYANGFQADLEAIGKVCRARDVFFIVDATQSICAYDLNAKRQNIDAVVFSGYKWVTAGYGIAVLFLGARLRTFAPPLVGWRSANTPYLLENDRLDLSHTGIGYEMGHPLFAGVFTLGAALALFSGIGVANVSARIDTLLGLLRARLKTEVFTVVSNPEVGNTSGILLVEMSDADVVAKELKKRDVYTSARHGGLRISLHAYNDESDVENVIGALIDVRNLAG